MFKRDLFVVLVFFIFASIWVTNSEDRNVIKLMKVVCDPVSPKYFFNFTCKTKPKSWDLSYAFMEGILLKDINNLTARLEVFKYYTQYRPFLINITVSYCDVMSGKLSSFYLHMFTRGMKNATNIFHPCPIKKGLIYARQLTMDGSSIKIPIPSGRFMLRTSFWEGYPMDFVGIASFYADIFEKNTKEKAKHKRSQTDTH